MRATARVIAREGFDRASTNRIAREAGVSIGSLYQYFPSKEAIVAAMVDRHVERVRSTLLGLAAEAMTLPLEPAARKLVGAIVDAHRVEPAVHRVVMEQIPKIGLPTSVFLMDAQIRALVRTYLVSRGAEATPALDTAVFTIMSATRAVTVTAVLDQPAMLEDGTLFDECVALIVRYLGPLLPERSAKARLARAPRAGRRR